MSLASDGNCEETGLWVQRQGVEIVIEQDDRPSFVAAWEWRASSLPKAGRMSSKQRDVSLFAKPLYDCLLNANMRR